MKKIILGILIVLTVLAVSMPQKTMVIGMIIGGRVVSPEGSSMLYHYCFGDGDTLLIDADYIKTSPVVLASVKNMKIGETKRVMFKQSKDWRLSYAFNPYHIKREKTGYLMYQYIKFDTSGKIYTDLNLGFTTFRVYDNIVHAFDCKPYVAVCRFTL